jgi:hypothetical protein|tara:strand:- start:21 stop:209 length:189 start_codon:yes stop_codon:yes gene_type:complete
MKQINIRISEETYEQLKRTAEKDRRSMSSLAQVLIIKGLERHRAEAVLSVEAVDGMMACTPK